MKRGDVLPRLLLAISTTHHGAMHEQLLSRAIGVREDGGTRARGRTRWGRLPTAPGAVFAAIACSCGPLAESQTGSLGNGTFSYNCTTPQDAFCPDDSTPASGAVFPTIAEGAEFEFTYMTSNNSNLQVEAASPAFLASEGPSFKALLVGSPWLVAVSRTGDAVDLTSVTVAPIASVQVASTGDININVEGTSATYGGTPMGTVGALAGTVAFTWTSSDESVVKIEAAKGGGPSGTVNVNLLKRGSATLTATAGRATGSLTVSVEGL